MKIQINKLLVCQKRVRRAEQIPSIVKSIKLGEFIPPVIVSETGEGMFRIEDGVHRSISYLLSGREYIEDGEFYIVPFNRSRVTTGTLVELKEKYEL